MDGENGGTEEQETALVEPMSAAQTPEAGAAAAVGAEPSGFAAAWSAVVADWINAHIRNSPIAAATEAWNHMGVALPRLGAMLEARLRGDTRPEA